jgi:CheY-like chemotaxis protein
MPEFRSVPIIAISASPIETSSKEIYHSGFTDFLAKPVKLKLLLETIQRQMMSRD